MTHRDTVVRLARSLVGSDHSCCQDIAPGYDLSRLSWCAVFALRVLGLAGLTELNWPKLVRRKWFGGWLPTTRHPQPGDVGVIIDTNGDGVPEYHHAIVERIEGDRIHTIDGNSIGRVVRLRERALREFNVFYSIVPLLEEPPSRAELPTVPDLPSAPPSGEVSGPVPPTTRIDTAAGLSKGLDVSAYQDPKAMDWAQLFSLGYSFVYVRGVRMGRVLDVHAAEHVRRARAAGFDVGLYGFFVPTEPVAQQLELMVEAHERFVVGPGDLAPALDLESYSSVKASPSWVAPAAEILDGYADRIGGAIRYHNVNDWHLMGSPAELQRFALWLADYTPPANLPCLLWQHASAPVPGYGMVLDQNVAHGELPRIGPATVHVQRPPIPFFDIRSTPESRQAAKDAYIRTQDTQYDE